MKWDAAGDVVFETTAANEVEEMSLEKEIISKNVNGHILASKAKSNLKGWIPAGLPTPTRMAAWAISEANLLVNN